jgi:hypothetical protein
MDKSNGIKKKHVENIPGLKICWTIGYPDCGISFFLSVPPDNCKIVPNSSHSHFLPYHF